MQVVIFTSLRGGCYPLGRHASEFPRDRNADCTEGNGLLYERHWVSLYHRNPCAQAPYNSESGFFRQDEKGNLSLEVA